VEKGSTTTAFLKGQRNDMKRRAVLRIVEGARELLLVERERREEQEETIRYKNEKRRRKERYPHSHENIVNGRSLQEIRI